MSNRKSATPKTPENAVNKSSFQIIRCQKCSCELARRDLPRHEEAHCRYVEDFLCKPNWKEDIKQHFDWDKDFGNSIIIDKTLLLNSSFHGISEYDLPTNIANLERALFFAIELMDHFKLDEGQNITLYIKKGKTVESQIYTVYKLETIRPKTIFTVCLKKGSELYRTFFPISENVGNKALFDMDLAVRTVELASICLELEKHRSDVFKFLTSCCLVQKLVQGELIQQNSTSIILEKGTLKIIQLLPVEDECSTDELQKKMTDLRLTNEKLIYQITSRTKIIFAPFTEISSDDVQMVGYDQQLDQIMKLILDSSEFCHKNSIQLTLPRSILLTGPTGTGKTIAMRQLFKKLEGKMNLIRIHASIFLSKQFEFERIESFFDMFVKLSPSVLFLDNLEDVANDKINLEKRVVSWLKVLLDSLPKSKPIFVIGACTETELLDCSLRRPGRFDLEIDFPIPTPAIRKQILKVELERTPTELSGDQLSQIAESTHGFTGADLKHLCDMSRLRCVNMEASQIIVTFDAVLKTLKTMKPSVMREISLEKPNIYWTDIGGMQQIRHLLEETVVWPIKHPEAFVRMGIEPPKGILMYGPPGCCKTMIGKALATESGLNFFSIKGPELFSKWVGESERAIREIFRKARAASPSILFFDEIDALAAERGQKQSAVGDRVLAQLLTEIDGVEKLSQVVIIAATNRPDIVDKALLRPGRLDSMVYVPLPNFETRKEIIKIRTGRMPIDGSITREQFICDLATKSDGYTGAEVTALCQTAGLAALSESIHSQFVTLQHFDAAFERVTPRIDQKLISFYEEFASRSRA